jgi:hypothetical protein
MVHRGQVMADRKKMVHDLQYKKKNFIFSLFYRRNLNVMCIKGHSPEKVVEMISLNHKFGSNFGTPTLFKVLKSYIKKLQLFMQGRSRCKIGSPDLQEFAAARTQNLYARGSSALSSLSVTLIHRQYVSA